MTNRAQHPDQEMGRRGPARLPLRTQPPDPSWSPPIPAPKAHGGAPSRNGRPSFEGSERLHFSRGARSAAELEASNFHRGIRAKSNLVGRNDVYGSWSWRTPTSVPETWRLSRAALKYDAPRSASWTTPTPKGAGLAPELESSNSGAALGQTALSVLGRARTERVRQLQLRAEPIKHRTPPRDHVDDVYP